MYILHASAVRASAVHASNMLAIKVKLRMIQVRHSVTFRLNKFSEATPTFPAFPTLLIVASYLASCMDVTLVLKYLHSLLENLNHV